MQHKAIIYSCIYQCQQTINHAMDMENVEKVVNVYCNFIELRSTISIDHKSCVISEKNNN